MLIISNPKAGDQKGSHFLREHVIPLLTRHPGSVPIAFEETSAPLDAGVIASKYLRRVSEGMIQEEPVILMSGGDTTMHEVVNGIIGLKQPVSVIIVPSGTANALYHSLFPPKGRELFLQELPSPIREVAETMDEEIRGKLYALMAFLAGGSTKRLYSTRTKILGATGEVTREIVSCVVVSASLHASILDGAEALRSTHPGIERFKIAAAQSITQWSDAQLKIKYPYQVYDRNLGEFRTLESQPTDTDATEFSGPFAYFLTTTNVDRLEMQFRITPLATSIPLTDDAGWMEVLMIRPHNQTQVRGTDEESRKMFAATTMKVLQAAYNDGSHLELSQGGGEESVVEYLRVRDWEWIPNDGSEPAHVICVDGEILYIPRGGRARVELLSGADRPELSVYCG